MVDDHTRCEGGHDLQLFVHELPHKRLHVFEELKTCAKSLATRNRSLPLRSVQQREEFARKRSEGDTARLYKSTILSRRGDLHYVSLSHKAERQSHIRLNITSCSECLDRYPHRQLIP